MRLNMTGLGQNRYCIYHVKTETNSQLPNAHDKRKIFNYLFCLPLHFWNSGKNWVYSGFSGEKKKSKVRHNFLCCDTSTQSELRQFLFFSKSCLTVFWRPIRPDPRTRHFSEGGRSSGADPSSSTPNRRKKLDGPATFRDASGKWFFYNFTPDLQCRYIHFKWD